jgi:hypothetical protein
MIAHGSDVQGQVSYFRHRTQLLHYLQISPAFGLTNSGLKKMAAMHMLSCICCHTHVVVLLVRIGLYNKMQKSRLGPTHLYILESRVTRRVCEKIAQNIA